MFCLFGGAFSRLVFMKIGPMGVLGGAESDSDVNIYKTTKLQQTTKHKFAKLRKVQNDAFFVYDLRRCGRDVLSSDFDENEYDF